MLTTKKRGLTFQVFSVIILSVTFLTACGPPGPRALQKGERLAAIGKYAEAIAKLEEATKLMTNAPEAEQAQAWNWLGVARHNQGLFVPASQAYQNARRLDRNLAPAAYNLGCLLLELKYYREGIDQLLTCLQLPHPPEISAREVYLKIGSAYLQQGMQATGAERNRQFDAAGRFLVEAHKLAPSAEALNGLGMFYALRYRSANSANEAVVRFKEALRLQPSYPPAMLNLAITHHFYLNDRRLALDEYKAYLALQPPPANAKEVEALVQQLERDLTASPSASVTPSATVTNKANADAATASSKVASADGDKTNTPNIVKSLPLAGKALAATKDVISPTNVDGAAGSEMAKIPAPPIQAAASVPTSSSVSTAVPDRPKLVTVTTAPAPQRWKYAAIRKPTPGNREEAARLIAQGRQAQRATNSVEALTAYRSAAKADPSNFEAWYRIGALAQESGNTTAALEAFERAVALNPESVDTRYAFGWALYKGKYPQDSVHELEELLKQAPGEIRAHLLIANIYAHDLNQPSLAREHYAKVLEIEPRNSQAAAIRAWLATGAM